MEELRIHDADIDISNAEMLERTATEVLRGLRVLNMLINERRVHPQSTLANVTSLGDKHNVYLDIATGRKYRELD